MTILVTGAGGGLGRNVVDAAVKRGLAVRALVRDPRRAAFGAGVEVVAGDATDKDVVTRAAAGCDALFHLVNVNFQADWVRSTRALLEAALVASVATGARLVFPGNVWIYGPGRAGVRVDEEQAATPTSIKGRARAHKEARLRESGARFTIVRLPEFYGPHVGTLTGPPLLRVAHGQRPTWFGPADVEAEFVFMPDAAQALLTIGLAADVDGAVFHLGSAGPITPRAFLGLAGAGTTSPPLRSVPSWTVRAAALVSPQAREFADILHLWTDPILLNGDRTRARFPSLTTTPYAVGVAATVAWLRQNPQAPMHF